MPPLLTDKYLAGHVNMEGCRGGFQTRPYSQQTVCRPISIWLTGGNPQDPGGSRTTWTPGGGLKVKKSGAEGTSSFTWVKLKRLSSPKALVNSSFSTGWVLGVDGKGETLELRLLLFGKQVDDKAGALPGRPLPRNGEVL